MSLSLYPLKLFLKKKSVLIPLIAALALNLAAWLWIFFGAREIGEQAVLHYTILFGVNEIGSYSGLYAPPAIGLGMLAANLVVAWVTYAYDTFLAALIMAGSVALQLAVVGTAATLVFLNS